MAGRRAKWPQWPLLRVTRPQQLVRQNHGKGPWPENLEAIALAAHDDRECFQESISLEQTLCGGAEALSTVTPPATTMSVNDSVTTDELLSRLKHQLRDDEVRTIAQTALQNRASSVRGISIHRLFTQYSI